MRSPVQEHVCGQSPTVSNTAAQPEPSTGERVVHTHANAPTLPRPNGQSERMDCGRLIRAARRSRRVSQRELAVLARVPHSTVDRAEAGRVMPRLQTLVDLLGALGYEFVIADRHGRLLELDDEHDRLRDRSGRHFPAHLEAAKLPDYFDREARHWWGWHHVGWPFGVGDCPDYIYWHRPKGEPTTRDHAT